MHNDPLGTPQALTNEAGQVIWTASYDPFGKATVNEDPDGDGNSVTLNVRFPGQYFDQETGLHYNYFRYYDPSIGRYITPEPLGVLGLIEELGLFEFQGGDANAYVYTLNNPLFYVDEDGATRKKYKKPQNPNKRRGADQRQPGGQRERNVRHPNAEEHSRRPKGIPKLPRIPGLVPLLCPLCEILKIPEPKPVPPLCQR